MTELRSVCGRAKKRGSLVEEIFGAEFARDWKEGLGMGPGAT